MFELPEDLKKISAGKIVDQKTQGGGDQRGRGQQVEDQNTLMDKQEKRAAKRRRQKQRKREEKMRA